MSIFSEAYTLNAIRGEIVVFVRLKKLSWYTFYCWYVLVTTYNTVSVLALWGEGGGQENTYSLYTTENVNNSYRPIIAIYSIV